MEQNKDWEKEFDESFITGEVFDEIHHEVKGKDIKEFIRNLLNKKNE